VWDEDVFYSEVIEAWANGPVVRDLYDERSPSGSGLTAKVNESNG